MYHKRSFIGTETNVTCKELKRSGQYNYLDPIDDDGPDADPDGDGLTNADERRGL